MPADVAKVKELFLALLEVPADERAAYLEKACAADTALRQRLEAMLRTHEQSGELLSLLPVQMLADLGTTPRDVTAAWTPQPETSASPPEPTTPDSDRLPFLAPSSQPGRLGRLGHYEVQEVIGQGGFGIVLRAFDDKLHRVVAIKVLAPAYATIGSSRTRFIREARAAAAVKNDHVVAIYNVQDEEQPPYLVMELIDGVTLQEKLNKRGALTIKEILRIGMQAAEGLAAAHKQGIVHRDIKPANILLENGVERVKITDFGLARAVDDASVSQSGTVAGTPMYMSPEQAEGLSVDHRSDLFSLGSVLYAMCTGQPPFRASGTHAVLRRVVEAAPRPIREINDEIPDWLAVIIGKLHARKAEARFQTATEVAALLGQHLAHLQQPGSVPAPPTIAAPASAPGSSLEKLLEATDHGKRLLQHSALLVGLSLTFPGIALGAIEPALFPVGMGMFLAAIPFLMLAYRVRQRWSVAYRGHDIRFENGCLTGEALYLDGQCVARGGVGLRNEVRAGIPSGEGTGEEIVVLADAGAVGFHCRIFVEHCASTRSTTTVRLTWVARAQRWLLAVGAWLCFAMLLTAGIVGLCRWVGIYPPYLCLLLMATAVGTALVSGTVALATRRAVLLRRRLFVLALRALLIGSSLFPLYFYLGASGMGHLDVTCDDPEVRIRIRDFWTDREVGPGQHEVPPPYKVRVTAEKNGEIFFTQDLPIGRYSGTSLNIPGGSPAFHPVFGGPDWCQLYDGRSYTGWKGFGDSNAGSGEFLLFPGGAVDTTVRLPRNCHLRMEVKLLHGAQGQNHAAQGTVRFHAKPHVEQFDQPLPRDGWFLNFSENQQRRINGQLCAPGIPPSPPAVSETHGGYMPRLGGWFYLEIIAMDKVTDVRINGRNVLTLQHADSPPVPGVLSLWNNGRGNGQIAFRNIEIRDLTPRGSTDTGHGPSNSRNIPD